MIDTNLMGVAGLTGLEILQAIIDGKIAPPPMALHMNVALTEVSKGTASFEGAAKQEHTNPTGAVHGGWYGSILDSALGCAVQTSLAKGVGYTTLEYKVNITRALPVGVRVRATATVSHAGRSTGVADAKLFGIEDGKLYATGSTTCIIFTPPAKT